jgi:peptidoglycan/LPS O-acetylase OafA/YrhL
MQGMEFGLIRGLLEFAIGATLYQISGKLNLKNRKWIGYDIVAICTILLIVCGRKNDFAIIAFIGILIFSLYSSSGIIKSIFSCPVMRYLGKISYTIYILQFPYQIT